MKTVAFVLALCVASAAATLRGAKPKTPAAALVGAVSDLNRVGVSIQQAFSNVQVRDRHRLVLSLKNT